MNFNLVDNIEYCYILVRDVFPLSMIYYSHISSIIISLTVGFFVFINNRKLLINKILFILSLVFSLWTFFNIVIWTSSNSAHIMLLWSLSGILIGLMFILSFYIAYVFINKKDLGIFEKIIIGLLFLPIIILTPTEFNLIDFSIVNDCEATEGKYFSAYYYLFGLFIFLRILSLLFFKYKQIGKEFKKQSIFFIVGIEFFLLSFFVTGFISSLTDYYELEFYGIFSMAIFMGSLAYLIVKYNTFNIKLLGAEALVAVLVILIGSQFAFIQNPTNQILTGITLFLAIVFGYILVRSVRREVREREQLAVLSHELEHANTELKELDKVKSEFISIVSHQLRTPLSVTKGYVSMILEGVYGVISDKIKDPLQKVYVSNEGLIALVNNLLDLSRMEAGTIKYDFVDADLVKMVDEIVMELELEAKHRNLYLKWTRPTEQLPMIKADTIKLKQVIEILIENSLKYTPQGGVNVSLAKDNNSLIFKVEDTGIGIEPHETEHLFNKFGRGKEGSRVNATGLGLGLYAAKQIVLKHNGTIWAESDGVGKGSRFLVRLPI